MMLGVVLQCVSTGIGLFIGSRVVIGWHRHRPSCRPVLISSWLIRATGWFFVAMYNCSFSLGAVLAAWVAYGSVYIPNSWAWRLQRCSRPDLH